MPSHSETRPVPWTARQMFDLVADVARYPEFLPWVIGARIKQRTADGFTADLIVGFRMFRETFTSKVQLNAPDRIDVDYVAGPLRNLANHWRFEDRPEGGSLIHFAVDFSFQSRLFESLVGGLFGEAVGRMAAAFEKRAAVVYGDGGGASSASATLTASSRT